MKHRIASVLAATALALLAPVAPARAEPPAQASALCTGAPNGCSIQARGWLREGATTEVTVIGNPHVRVQLMVYEAAVANGQLTALEPVSRNAEVFTNAAGVAHANVTIPARTAGASVGWALLSVGGLAGTDVSTTVGQFMPYGARVPTLLGDGFAAAGKPVGQTVELQLVGAVPGTGFAVDYADDAGNWKEITTEGGTTATSPDQISTVHYTVPRGLLIKAYKFRLRNISDSATSPLWLGTPHQDGIPETRTSLFVPPPVGQALTGTFLNSTHPALAVTWASWGLGGVTLAWVAGSLLFRISRRPRWETA